MSSNKDISPTKMKQKNSMSLIGIIIFVGIGILLLPLIPFVILGYIFLRLKPSSK